jgi:hypothetical protein
MEVDCPSCRNVPKAYLQTSYTYLRQSGQPIRQFNCIEAKATKTKPNTFSIFFASFKSPSTSSPKDIQAYWGARHCLGNYYHCWDTRVNEEQYWASLETQADWEYLVVLGTQMSWGNQYLR